MLETIERVVWVKGDSWQGCRAAGDTLTWSVLQADSITSLRGSCWLWRMPSSSEEARALETRWSKR